MLLCLYTYSENNMCVYIHRSETMNGYLNKLDKLGTHVKKIVRNGTLWPENNENGGSELIQIHISAKNSYIWKQGKPLTIIIVRYTSKYLSKGYWNQLLLIWLLNKI